MNKCKTIMLIITYECNLNCAYCYEPKSLHKKMSAEQAKLCIKKVVSSLDCTYEGFEVQFMGGEPLLAFKLIKEVSEWLWSTTWPVPLRNVFSATNGTLLDEEMKCWFSQNRNKICLGLSLDGNRAMQNINRSLSYDDIDLEFFVKLWPSQSVKMTISPNTIGDLYDGVMHLYSRGVEKIEADLAVGKNVNWEQNHLRTFSEQLQKLADYYINHPERQRISFLDIDVISVLHENEKRFKHCGCGEQLVCVDCDGVEYACHLFSPVSTTLQQAKKSKTIDFSNYSEFATEKCKNCLLINICTRCCGINYQSQGNIAEPSSFSCSAFRIQFAISCSMQLRLAESIKDEYAYKEIKKIIQILTNASKYE